MTEALRLFIVAATMMNIPAAAHASDQTFQNNAPRTTFSSATHVGYGSVRSSSTGHRGQGGSTLFLDLRYLRAPGWRLGFRTIAEGSLVSNDTFHRLSTGPLLGRQFGGGYELQAWIGVFSETANEGTNAVYRSRGIGMMSSLRREILRLGDFCLTWGAYLSFYSGNLRTTASIAGERFRRTTPAALNQGYSQGLTLAVELPLR